ncbi:beta-mannosidase, partial [Streptomyces hydrogenans]
MTKSSRRTWLTAAGSALAGVAGLLLPVFGAAGAAQAADGGIHVSNGRVHEANGNEFVMRGV